MLIQEPDDNASGGMVFPHALRDGKMHDNEMPDVDPCARDASAGARPQLRAGDAVLYYLLHADQHQAALPSIDRRSQHWHCPVAANSRRDKWGGFIFAHNR